jgi:NTP pyrophosphatase (non-canonical NTP hydrolase)
MPISLDQYPDFVAVRSKGGEAIAESLDPGKCDLMHMAIGIAGESGEFLDCVKKHIIYGQPLNRENALEELGDIEFYLQGARNALGLSREEVLAANIAKLEKRYPVEYSDSSAKARADKLAPRILEGASDEH